jgi:hypothetical protein
MSIHAMRMALAALEDSISIPCYGGHPKQEAAYVALRTAIEADEKQGISAQQEWKLVPVEPTKEMFLAGHAVPCSPSQDEDAWFEDYRSVYQAMIQAAPAPKKGSYESVFGHLGMTPDELGNYVIDLQEKAAQREWVGLMDADVYAAADKEEQSSGFIQGAYWAEDKLKEKNHVD